MGEGGLCGMGEGVIVEGGLREMGEGGLCGMGEGSCGMGEGFIYEGVE